jgi:hypothetical protein
MDRSWHRGWLSTWRKYLPNPEDRYAESSMTAFIRNRAFGLALVAASLVALVLSGYSSYQTRAYSQCQSNVTEALIQASIARADAAEEDRKADREESRATSLLIQTVFTATTTDERIAAYSVYAQTLGRLDEQRAATATYRAQHPLPEPPSQTCS